MRRNSRARVTICFFWYAHAVARRRMAAALFRVIGRGKLCPLSMCGNASVRYLVRISGASVEALMVLDATSRNSSAIFSTFRR